MWGVVGRLRARLGMGCGAPLGLASQRQQEGQPGQETGAMEPRRTTARKGHLKASAFQIKRYNSSGFIAGAHCTCWTGPSPAP